MVKEIRTRLAANIAAGWGLDGQVSAYTLANVMAPSVQVTGPSVTFDGAFQRGLHELSFKVVVQVGYATDRGAQELLDEFLEPAGPRSIKLLIESDRTLGGACQDLRVTEASGPLLYAVDSVQGAATPPMVGCEWTVQVLA